MAKDFSKSGVKELIASAEKLLDDLDKASSTHEELRTRLIHNISSIRKTKADAVLSSIKIKRIGQNNLYIACDDTNEPSLLDCDPTSADLVIDENDTAHSISSCFEQVRSGCRLQLSTDKRDAISVSIVLAAWAYTNASTLEQERANLAHHLREEIEPLLKDVQVGCSTTRWLFSSKNKKNVAQKSYQLISDILNGELGTEARRVLTSLRHPNQVSENSAWEWFESDAEKAQTTIQDICPDSIGVDDWPVSYRELRETVESANSLLSAIESHAKRPAQLESSVKNAIACLQNEEILDILKDVPIDELNRNKRRIRISALKEDGYENVAQICTTNHTQLSNIPGISLQGARNIKTVALELAEATREGIKIKLSIDDKSPAATKVVKAGYALSLWMEMEKLNSSTQTNLNTILSDLEPGLKPLAWVFASEQEKTRVEAGYASLTRYLASDEVARIHSTLNKFDVFFYTRISDTEAWAAFESNPISILNALESITPDAFGNDDILFGLPEELAGEVQNESLSPDGLLCTLRRYQEMGVKYILHQKRTLLGDEMGLGKTVQAIAAMVSLENAGETHFIVICPTSVLENWSREVEKHSRLKAHKIHGTHAELEFSHWKNVGGVAITTYGTTGNLALEDNFKYGLGVVDEAHYIKNTGTLRTVNTLKLLKGARRICFMTGTALENKVEEMLTLIGYLRPDIAQKAKTLALVTRAKKFRDTIAPVYYRRKREDVLTELPELIEKEEWCSLGPVEKAAYKAAVLTMSQAAVRRVSWNLENLAEDSSKAKRMLEIINDAEADGRKALVFTFFLETAASVAALLSSKCVGIINGSVPPAKRQEIVEAFGNAQPGSVLVSQIQSGDIGMNIQAASVVIFCEPQYKPSTERQAISRAYRIGQARNVLVYHLLCENTVDERIVEIIHEKQMIFDTFADKSSAAAAAEAENIAVDDASMKKIIMEEIERIKAESAGLSADTEDEAYSPIAAMKQMSEQGVSVWGRIRQVAQPRGGYINPKSMDVRQLGIGKDALHPAENVSPALIGLVVEYLTRLMLGTPVREAFRISQFGAIAVHKRELFETLLSNVKGLETISIAAATKLVGFDNAYRAGKKAYRPVEEIEPDAATIENIRTMVKRALTFFDIYGPVTLAGFTLEGGYTETVASGDGDFLAEDTLWDFKVSKHSANKDQTLQLLMYWRMGLHSVHPEFKNIKKLGTYNPRRNEISTIETAAIPKDVIKTVEQDVIGYERPMTQ